MVYYIESPSNNPYFNLALEQYVFDQLNREHEYFMLWQNDNTIVVGKHQNTIQEINGEYVEEHGIRVVRRLSGGGAVYHDMGNVNFTFIVDNVSGSLFDFATFCTPVTKALASIGVTAELNGRNDMTIDGKKFSGNSQYMKQGRIMHHGTIMYDSDLSIVSKALAVSPDKFQSKGHQSVRSRITNVRPYVKEAFGIQDFWQKLREFMFEMYDMKPYTLTPADLVAVQQLQKDVYEKWEWNYGASPAYQVKKERRVEGCGRIEIYLDVENGVIKDIFFRGDYFSHRSDENLIAALRGCPLEAHAVSKQLGQMPIGEYFNHLDRETFIAILSR